MIENKDGDGIKLPSPADVYLKEINETKNTVFLLSMLW
jgi:hypothetical protein